MEGRTSVFLIKLILWSLKSILCREEIMGWLGSFQTLIYTLHRASQMMPRSINYQRSPTTMNPFSFPSNISPVLPLGKMVHCKLTESFAFSRMLFYEKNKTKKQGVDFKIIRLKQDSSYAQTFCPISFWDAHRNHLSSDFLYFFLV